MNSAAVKHVVSFYWPRLAKYVWDPSSRSVVVIITTKAAKAFSFVAQRFQQTPGAVHGSGLPWLFAVNYTDGP